jgi:hypothetical protein
MNDSTKYLTKQVSAIDEFGVIWKCDLNSGMAINVNSETQEERLISKDWKPIITVAITMIRASDDRVVNPSPRVPAVSGVHKIQCPDWQGFVVIDLVEDDIEIARQLRQHEIMGFAVLADTEEEAYKLFEVKDRPHNKAKPICQPANTVDLGTLTFFV